MNFHEVDSTCRSLCCILYQVVIQKKREKCWKNKMLHCAFVLSFGLQLLPESLWAQSCIVNGAKPMQLSSLKRIEVLSDRHFSFQAFIWVYLRLRLSLFNATFSNCEYSLSVDYFVVYLFPKVSVENALIYFNLFII